MYSAMRALIEPDGFMNSHLAKTPSTSISGVSPIASRIDADTELKRVAIRESCSAARPTVIPPRASTMADPRQAAAGPVLGRSPAHRRLPPQRPSKPAMALDFRAASHPVLHAPVPLAIPLV